MLVAMGNARRRVSTLSVPRSCRDGSNDIIGDDHGKSFGGKDRSPAPLLPDARPTADSSRPASGRVFLERRRVNLAGASQTKRPRLEGGEQPG